ncbi:CDP-diacylglycerol--serine O-phosphatidyltransferase [Sporomusa termitida]|uniref:CDP-diacylglycerol--serine O-phosphatidyltransferase n=1 Tax=Sporomusa termitida TaxID=2377 RepID=A0A517DTF5_9FIRM|nr:CDP-diacylglycerol--serine O-phosphatidyltransferase [Sporomusa termitida]QDR80644.1 pssA: CDP-diacylglycerol-serine O-phosphatidyltransferase [Sporomusa termitida]
MRNAIPNILTAVNIVLGMFAIIFTFQGEFTAAALFIIAALVADGLDGRVARYFGVSSDFGKELDSLCDLVSFGVAPAILAYAFMLKDFGTAGYIIAAAFATCGALRLARFNVNTGSVKGYFMGLPIPTAGCVVATFVMVGLKPAGWIFPLMVAIFAYLMVSTIRYPDFKGKGGEPLRLVPAVIAVAVGIYILTLTLNAVLFVPFFVYSLFGILNTLFGVFARH